MPSQSGESSPCLLDFHRFGRPGWNLRVRSARGIEDVNGSRPPNPACHRAGFRKHRVIGQGADPVRGSGPIGRDRLRAGVGDVARTLFPDRQRLGGRHLRLQRRRQDGPLFRHLQPPAARKDAEGLQPALQESGRRQVRGRDGVVGPWFPRILPRDRRRGRGQRRRSGRLPLQPGRERPLFEQRGRDLSRRQLDRWRRQPELVVGGRVPRLRQRWRPRPLRCRVWPVGHQDRRRPLVRRDFGRGPQDADPPVLLARRRSAPRSTCFTATTA